MTLATRLLLRVYKKVVIQSARERKRFKMPIQFYASHGSRKGFVNDFLAHLSTSRHRKARRAQQK